MYNFGYGVDKAINNSWGNVQSAQLGVKFFQISSIGFKNMQISVRLSAAPAPFALLTMNSASSS